MKVSRLILAFIFIVGYGAGLIFSVPTQSFAQGSTPENPFIFEWGYNYSFVWNASVGADGYTFHWGEYDSENPTSFSFQQSIETTEFDIDERVLELDKIYQCTVTAYNEYGTSDFSDSVYIILPSRKIKTGTNKLSLGSCTITIRKQP